MAISLQSMLALVKCLTDLKAWLSDQLDPLWKQPLLKPGPLHQALSTLLENENTNSARKKNVIHLVKSPLFHHDPLIND